jgi:ribosomal protein S18 acetylase RimI-like enzyme
MFRAPEPGDLDAVLAVIVARDVADLGAPDFTRDDLEQDWREPGWQLGRDARVAEQDGRIVGYADLRRQVAQGYVHPEAEGRGIGSGLLAWLERRAAAPDAPGRLRQLVPESNRRARELLGAAGWRPAWTYWRLAIDLDAPPPAAASPAGVELRTLALPEDGLEIHGVSESAFAALGDHDPETFEEFDAEHLAAHDLDPSLSPVAVVEGRVAGFALVRRWSDQNRGFVNLLAVAPAHSGRGVGRALLHAAFAACRSAGLRGATLGVGGHNERALGLYERAGMRREWRVDRYEPATG